MNHETIAKITTDRLALWAQRAIEQHATPVLMLSVGHDHKSGELNVHTTVEMTDADMMLLVQGALQIITSKVRDRIVGS